MGRDRLYPILLSIHRRSLTGWSGPMPCTSYLTRSTVSLNELEVRPLDYDYLFQLSPAPQRLYELLSFPMYGALSNDRPRARLRYSEFCTFAPVARYLDFDPVKNR